MSRHCKVKLFSARGFHLVSCYWNSSINIHNIAFKEANQEFVNFPLCSCHVVYYIFTVCGGGTSSVIPNSSSSPVQAHRPLIGPLSSAVKLLDPALKDSSSFNFLTHSSRNSFIKAHPSPVCLFCLRPDNPAPPTPTFLLALHLHAAAGTKQLQL